jgi:hypothetical protein
MNQEVVVITEDQFKLLYELLQKPYMVYATIVIYSYEENGKYNDIELDVMNNGIFTAFILQYNDGENKDLVIKYEYDREKYEDLVYNMTNLLETDRVKKKIDECNNNTLFLTDKNIVIKTYKSA